jgi:hypothetical protein
MMRLMNVGIFVCTALVVSACDREQNIYKMKSSSSTSTLNGPGDKVVATEHAHFLAGSDGTLTLTCKKSDTNTCHYRVWQVVTSNAGSSETKVSYEETFFSLTLNQSKAIKRALEGSSFCQSSEKSPDAATCTRVTI